MADKKDSHRQKDGLANRRRFLQWATSAGLASIAPGTVTAIADVKEKKAGSDTTASGQPTSDVNITHATELPKTQKRVEQYNNGADSKAFYQRALAEQLRRNPGKKEFDLVVTTIGEATTVETNRYGRTVNGWKPTSNELATLGEYGDIGYVPEFSSTDVVLRNVARRDLPRIAAAEFVLSINIEGRTRVNGCGDSDCNSGIGVDSLRSTSYFSFDTVDSDYTVDSNVRVGVIDTGYDGSKSCYESSYAADIGIDENLAKDFTGSGTWNEDEYSHGTHVADTIAYMLGTNKGHSNLFVPLRANESSNDDRIANVKQATEYALKNDIEVINNSLALYLGDSTGSTDYCPQKICAEHDAYTNAGYLPFATAGNDGYENKVDIPGGSWLTIGVGGIDQGSCSGNDYSRDSASDYAPNFDYTQCSYCDYYANSGSAPTVYGAYHTATDASGSHLCGTSFASPQAAAAGVIMVSNDQYSYVDSRQIFEEMNTYTICPDDAAKRGQLIDAYHAWNQTSSDPNPM
ncbi:S8/S53 family peptidase [Halorussus salinus]|uniref:S8/S53 family peptidase n=1 Tax=Halorussus salinus TaxID=1364935 RepID=UPI001092DBA4|nr:S8/S53 family peptidase [Halorussus salinus]